MIRVPDHIQRGVMRRFEAASWENALCEEALRRVTRELAGRIAAAGRTDQKLYNHAELKSVFQRGHMVKRTDPSWGTPERAIRGQSDTP